MYWGKISGREYGMVKRNVENYCLEKEKGISGMGTGKWEYWIEIGFRGRGPQKGKITKKTRKEKSKGKRKWETDIYGWDAGRKSRVV
jgi:hypothetical protein